MKDEVKAVSQIEEKTAEFLVLAGMLQISHKKKVLKSKSITKYKNIGAEEKIVFLSLTFFPKTYAI